MAPKIPENMLAAQVVEFKKPYKIHEVPTPGKDLNEHDPLAKVAVDSLCHTDGMVTDGIMRIQLPCIASHEGAGTIVKVGSARKEFEVGVTVDGSFAECEVVDGREVCLLPDNVSFQCAVPLACAGITIWGGLVRGDLKVGESLALVGAGGGLGHLGVQFAKALGLHVIAIDARDEGIQLAQQCGADTVIDARIGKEKVVEKVKTVTGGKGADASINVSDRDTAAGLSAAVTKMHGILVQIAQPTTVSVPFAELVFRDIRIHGSLTGSRAECQKMLEIVSKSGVKVKTTPFNGIKEVPKAVELSHSGKMQ
ncbi:hypothetical protein G7Y89_g1993 [Cudoniella acicularis]|uniref:Enoyl reductase (ER) domain-containing protein n=1 Tax=Cudoniella acicularis TaxID=354080 RepID=A0A8H4RW05_9HELO|nr:hypothetical protein G7Y89_g1993 [Cudoniella acicularis]